MPINLAEKQKRYDNALANYRNACDYANKASVAKKATLSDLNKIADEICKEIESDIEFAAAIAPAAPVTYPEPIKGGDNASK